MTGSAFHVRESDADARADAEAMSSSVGIMAALLLTLCVPVLFDSVYGVQTNSYMVTDPAWIGITYFFFLTMAMFLFAFSVVCAILTILVTRQLSSQSESRLLFKIARAEFIMPVQHVTFGLMSMVTAFAFWLYIVFFDKSAVVECGEPSSTSTSALLSLNVSSDAAHSREKCSWYPELFIAIACWFIPVSMMTLNSATNLIAKLQFVQDDTDPTDPEIYDPDEAQIREDLKKYEERKGFKLCDPEGFQEFMLQQSKKDGLSYIAKKLADIVFEERVKTLAPLIAKHLKAKQHPLSA